MIEVINRIELRQAHLNERWQQRVSVVRVSENSSPQLIRHQDELLQASREHGCEKFFGDALETVVGEVDAAHSDGRVSALQGVRSVQLTRPLRGKRGQL